MDVIGILGHSQAVVGQSRKVMDVSLTDPNVEINVIPEASLPESHYIRSKGGVLATMQKTHVHKVKPLKIYRVVLATP